MGLWSRGDKYAHGESTFSTYVGKGKYSGQKGGSARIIIWNYSIACLKVNEIRTKQDAKLNVLARVEIFGHMSRNLAKKLKEGRSLLFKSYGKREKDIKQREIEEEKKKAVKFNYKSGNLTNPDSQIKFHCGAWAFARVLKVRLV